MPATAVGRGFAETRSAESEGDAGQTAGRQQPAHRRFPMFGARAQAVEQRGHVIRYTRLTLADQAARSIHHLQVAAQRETVQQPGTLWWGFAWFFCLLLAYYVLRPVREVMGISGGTDRLQWLFLATFLVMLAAVPIYGALVARVPRRTLVRAVYHFFALNLLFLGRC